MSEDEVFEYAVNIVLQHEGRYANQIHDEGGETKYGISRQQYPNLDIANLTQDDAKKIYRTDFWDKSRCSEILNRELAIKIFDLSVNLGLYEAALLTQKALCKLGVEVRNDGILGSETIGTINIVDNTALLDQLKDMAASHYKEIVLRNPEEKKFLAGWLKRAYS